MWSSPVVVDWSCCVQQEEKRREDLMARAANCAKEQIQWDDEVEGNAEKKKECSSILEKHIK